MDRRAFIAALAALCGCAQKEESKNLAEPSTAPPFATAQPSGVPRIAMLYFGAAPSTTSSWTDAFRRRLSDLGYVDGKTILVEERYADGDPQRLSQIAREIATSNVDVIVAQAVAATVAARQATNKIPIVMLHAGNADSLISAGLITSLAQPGGNVTGTTNVPHGGKQVDLLRELVPNVTKLVLLANPTNSGAPAIVAAASEAARKSNIGVVIAEVASAQDFSVAFAAIRSAHPSGLVVAVDPLIIQNGGQLIDFVATERLPAIYDNGEMVRRGGLIAYATKYIDHYPLAAEYVDKILKGAKPADLPVGQPARFELVINLNTAKTLGLAIPRDLLLRADQVIQ